MRRFAANLTLAFTEIGSLGRFLAAAGVGFSADWHAPFAAQKEKS
jgi:hydroxypyruvate isomerase